MVAKPVASCGRRTRKQLCAREPAALRRSDGVPSASAEGNDPAITVAAPEYPPHIQRKTWICELATRRRLVQSNAHDSTSCRPECGLWSAAHISQVAGRERLRCKWSPSNHASGKKSLLHDSSAWDSCVDQTVPQQQIQRQLLGLTCGTPLRQPWRSQRKLLFSSSPTF